MNDTPEKGATAPLNFGGSSPFTSGQTEPLTDAPVTTDADPVAEPTQEAPGTPAAEEAPTQDQGEEPVTATSETETAPADQAAATPAEPMDNGEAGRILAGEDPDQVFADNQTEEVPTQTASEDQTSATEAPAGEVSASDEQPAEQVGEVTAPTIEQEESTPVVPADASTTPAEELAPTAEVPATPQTELEAEVAKELNAQAGIPADVPNISSATDAEIDNAIKERDALNAKIEDGQKAQRQDVLAQIKKVVETYKIPLAELGEYLGIKGTRKGSKAKPKYRNPDDGKEWSGRGKEPLWIKGKDRKDFLITT